MSDCKECGSSNIIEDRQHGHAVCRDCGAVVESNFIVSEVQFEETSGGGVRALGTRIGGGGVTQVGGIQGTSGSDERRRQLLNRAREEIRRIASVLNFSDNAISQATNFYDQALNRKLTIGVRWVKSLSACIYIVARLDNMPVMLLDLSDVVQVNVWELGQIYQKICRGLFLTIPLQDPSLLIMRFAQRLELGDKCQRVMNTGVRICQRMNRDWMHIGRRPAGLCGSALLAACRYHGFNRSFQDFAELVCISTSTLKLRLKEFADTPAGKMQLGDFLISNDSDIVDEILPPISKHHKKVEEQGIDEALLEETRKFQEQLEKIIEQRQIDVAMRFTTCMNDVEITKQFELTPEEMDLLNEQFSTVDTFEHQLVDNDEQRSPGAIEQRVGDYIVPENRSDDNFSDIDDEEIDKYLLKRDEVVRKTKKWVKENMQFLKEFREKAKRQKEQGDCPTKKRRAPPRKKNPQKLLEDVLAHKSSGKINYDILSQLESNCQDIPPGLSFGTTKKLKVSIKQDGAKKELQQDLMEIHSIAKTIKQNINKLKSDPEQPPEAPHNEEIEILDDDYEEDEEQGMSVSQIMSQEMGYDFGGADDDF